MKNIHLMLTSAVSSTSAIVAGAAVASVFVAVLLFATLVFREHILLSEHDSEQYRRSFGATVAALAIVFLLNVVVQTAAVVS